MSSPNGHTTERASLPATMSAAVARSYGTAEMVAIEQVPVPTPGNGEVLIKVEASSLNALDWHFLTGTPYLIRMNNGIRNPKRIIHGADVAGTVVAVGPEASDFSVGDRVFGETNGGGCASYLSAEQSTITPLPPEISFNDAAAIPVAGLTAVQALRTHAKLQPGESVLINGAAGGVGTTAVQVAKALGAEVTAVCSSRNVEMVRAIGADRVIDYTTSDYVADGGRYHVMMDNVGNRNAADCIGLLHPGGRYVVVSGPKENRWLGPVPHVLGKALAFRRTDKSFHQFVAEPVRDDLDFLAELAANGRLVPQIQRVVGLDGVTDGLAEIGTGHARAKIVVIPG